MISLEKCRQLVPDLKNLSDEEVIEVRENLYEAGSLALEAWVEENSGSKNPLWVLSDRA